ncbi:MAG: serpin family protein [candidate division Zixibacteria bacterium]|nr:serpin family protein [candidate division Zixibacteria bacterium]
MNKWKFVVVLVLAIVGVLYCSCSHSTAPPDPEPPRALTAAEQQVVQSGENFGLDFFSQVAAENPDTNVVVSPVSVAMALAMAYNGADGTTREAIQSTIALDGLSPLEVNEAFQGLISLLTGLDNDVTMTIANSIWLREGFQVRQPFIETNQQYLNADVTSLDFSNPSSAGIMNQWVSDNTNGLIEQIIDPPIDPLTLLFLINALYFKGDWTRPFNPELTTGQPFYGPTGSVTSCQLMMINEELPYYESDLVQVVDLSYGRELFSMMVILPRPGVHVDSALYEMTSNSWDHWQGAVGQREGMLYLPKFELEVGFLLNNALSVLGMVEAFDPSQADFSNISEQIELYITQVIHKVYIRVDEEGTEAAAVTAIGIGTTSEPPDNFVMRIDRPFLFAIYERHSGTLLFVGRVTHPN